MIGIGGEVQGWMNGCLLAPRPMSDAFIHPVDLLDETRHSFCVSFQIYK